MHHSSPCPPPSPHVCPSFMSNETDHEIWGVLETLRQEDVKRDFMFMLSPGTYEFSVLNLTKRSGMGVSVSATAETSQGEVLWRCTHIKLEREPTSGTTSQSTSVSSSAANSREPSSTSLAVPLSPKVPTGRRASIPQVSPPTSSRGKRIPTEEKLGIPGCGCSPTLLPTASSSKLNRPPARPRSARRTDSYNDRSGSSRDNSKVILDANGPAPATTSAATPAAPTWDLPVKFQGGRVKECFQVLPQQTPAIFRVSFKAVVKFGGNVRIRSRLVKNPTRRRPSLATATAGTGSEEELLTNLRSKLIVTGGVSM